MTAANTLSPDASSALSVVKRILSSLEVPGPPGRAQFMSTLDPPGQMCHARYPFPNRADVFYTDFKSELPDYVKEAWDGKEKMEEHIDGEPTVMVDHDIAMVWTPYYVTRNGKLSHVGTNCFLLVKLKKDVEGEGEGVGGEEGKDWEWKITGALDTGRMPSEEDKKRLAGTI